MKRTLLTLLTGTSLLAAACGDDGGDAPAAQPSTTAPDDTAAGTVHEVPVPAGAEAVGEPMPRLAVADATTGAVELVDLATGESIGTFDATGPAALASDGRIIYATDHDGGAVTLIDGGSWVDDHGDHGHAYVAEPALIGTVEGPDPAHVVVNDGITAVFFDGRGEAELFEWSALVDGDLAPSATVATARPHHGVVVALAGHVVATIPGSSADDLPIGVEVRHGDGQVEATFADCPELHGEAASAEGLLLACADGLLWVHGGEGGWVADRLAHPVGTGPGDRAWSLAHTDGVPVVAGVLGDDAVLVVDTTTGATQRIAMPTEPVAVAVSGEGEHVVALTADGELHLVHVADGAVEASAPVTAPVAASDEAGPAPRLLVVGDRTYVSDPAAGTILEVDHLDGLRVARTFDVSVTPARLAVSGAP